MPKKILLAIPPAMLAQVDSIAKLEHRTRSDLVREALRRYIKPFLHNQQNAFSQTMPTTDVLEDA